MTTYPLPFPDVCIRSLTFEMSNATTSSVSPYTGNEQVYAFAGQWWQGDAEFIPTKAEDSAKIRSFMTALRGRFGTFTFTPDDALNQLGAGGTINVDGALQSGRTLNLKDMTASTVIGKAGDYFQLGLTLYQYTQDLISDASGLGKANFEPALRLSPSDGAALIMSEPKGIFRMVEDTMGTSKRQPDITDPVTISFREVIGG